MTGENLEFFMRFGCEKEKEKRIHADGIKDVIIKGRTFSNRKHQSMLNENNPTVKERLKNSKEEIGALRSKSGEGRGQEARTLMGEVIPLWEKEGKD